MAPATPPRSSTEVAAALRDLALNLSGETALDRRRRATALEAAEHIETLVAALGLSEISAGSGQQSKTDGLVQIKLRDGWDGVCMPGDVIQFERDGPFAFVVGPAQKPEPVDSAKWTGRDPRPGRDQIPITPEMVRGIFTFDPRDTLTPGRKGIASDPITGRGDARSLRDSPAFRDYIHAKTDAAADDAMQRLVNEKLASPEEMVAALRSYWPLRMAVGVPVATLCQNAAALIEKLSADVREAVGKASELDWRLNNQRNTIAEYQRQEKETNALAERLQDENAALSERSLNAEQEVERLSGIMAGRSTVLISGCIAAHGKALPVEKIGQLFDAFAKFDADDWDYLLGEKGYQHGGHAVAYRADIPARRNGPLKAALAKLRSICEAAKPKEERPEPSELARLFVKRWAPNLSPAEQEEMALSFDHEVAQEMVRSAD